MEKSYTLWEKWTGQVPEEPAPKPEDMITNPLRLHRGDLIVSKMPEEDERKYSVVEVREYNRRISGIEFRSADYLLRDGEEERVLRVNPRRERDPDDPRECDLLWLEFFDRMEFDEGVRQAVTKEEFYVFLDNDEKVTYYELHAGKDGFFTDIRSVKSGEESLYSRRIQYWDFFKKGETKYNEPEGEDVFFFVEIDESDGFIAMLKGMRVSSRDVEIYPAGEKNA